MRSLLFCSETRNASSIQMNLWLHITSFHSSSSALSASLATICIGLTTRFFLAWSVVLMISWTRPARCFDSVELNLSRLPSTLKREPSKTEKIYPKSILPTSKLLKHSLRTTRGASQRCSTKQWSFKRTALKMSRLSSTSNSKS